MNHAHDGFQKLTADDSVHSPLGQVDLDPSGLFRRAAERSTDYLLSSFSTDHMLHSFRARAGQANPNAPVSLMPYWDTHLGGSNASRFLMGAGNLLQWGEHGQLRGMLQEVVDGIAACREPNGYALGFPVENLLPASEEEQKTNHNSNYTLSWFVYGMLAAGAAGSETAMEILRGQADWFLHHCPQKVLQGLNKAKAACCGQIAFTQIHGGPVGRPEDIELARTFYPWTDWAQRLAERDLTAIWESPLNGYPHCYEIPGFEAMLDLYCATGEHTYLDAVLGAWEMIHGHWEHIGGSMAICEWGHYPPGSYFLTKKNHTGELCGSVFWIHLNHRLHRMFPQEERYVAEIEKSIYNVGLACQVPGAGIRYHALLDGEPEQPQVCNTCCEGQGSRLYGELPSFIYSVSKDEIYVNLFEPSSLKHRVAGTDVAIRLETAFPFHSRIALHVEQAVGARWTLHIRIPGWVEKPVPLRLNGEPFQTGKPGTFLSLTHEWVKGDRVEFDLPTTLRSSKYSGQDAVAGCERYAFEAGPVLLAFTNDMTIPSDADPNLPASWMMPDLKQPLQFGVVGNSTALVQPYFAVESGRFTCFPTKALG